MQKPNPGDSNAFKLVIQFVRVCVPVCVVRLNTYTAIK